MKQKLVTTLFGGGLAVSILFTVITARPAPGGQRDRSARPVDSHATCGRAVGDNVWSTTQTCFTGLPTITT